MTTVQPEHEKVIYCSRCGSANPDWRSQCENCDMKLATLTLLENASFPALPGCVTVYIVLLGIGAALFGLEGFGALAHERTALQGIFDWALAALSILVMVGLWQQRKWGRTLLIVLLSTGILVTIVIFFVTIVISSGAELPLLYIVSVLINSYILWWFWSNGEYFK